MSGSHRTPTDFEVQGVEDIMSAYSKGIHAVTPSGRTSFGKVVNSVAEMASDSLSKHNNKYFVLLIITDGAIMDLQETIDALVSASDLPLSIMIVGVGNADFKLMEFLDADNTQALKSSTGRLAARDNVQFFPKRQVLSKHISVVQSLLEELPGQFMTYSAARASSPSPLPIPF